MSDEQRNQVKDALMQILTAAQTIRIQQVQTVESPRLRAEADRAWAAFGQSHLRIWHLLSPDEASRGRAKADLNHDEAYYLARLVSVNIEDLMRKEATSERLQLIWERQVILKKLQQKMKEEVN